MWKTDIAEEHLDGTLEGVNKYIADMKRVCSFENMSPEDAQVKMDEAVKLLNDIENVYTNHKDFKDKVLKPSHLYELWDARKTMKELASYVKYSDIKTSANEIVERAEGMEDQLWRGRKNYGSLIPTFSDIRYIFSKKGACYLSENVSKVV